MREWEQFTNQEQWKAYIQNLVKTNDAALHRAILLIYDLQTDEEKRVRRSIDDNAVGFGKVDAREMADIAEKVRAGQPLSEGEAARARNKMARYWKQLMRISKARMASERLRRDYMEAHGYGAHVNSADGQLQLEIP